MSVSRVEIQSSTPHLVPQDALTGSAYVTDPRFTMPVGPGRRVLCPKTGIVYEIGDQIGSGAAAVVFKCRRVTLATADRPESLDSRELAAKVMDLRGLRLRTDYQRERDKLRSEVSILSRLHHPCIVDLLHVIETRDELFLIMEFVRAGELFYKIVEKGALTEDQARYVLLQILPALQYMHNKGVIHRDLKPENILISDEVAPGFYRIQMADFGLAKFVRHGVSEAKTFVGTPQYWAPEVIESSTNQQTYGPEADLWSLGCLIYVMLGGTYPFDSRLGPIDVLIKNGQFHFKYARFERVSVEAKDVIRGLLTVDPKRRLTIDQLFNHPWLTNFYLPPGVPLLPSLEPLSSEGYRLPLSARSVLGADPPAVPLISARLHPPNHSLLASDRCGSHRRPSPPSGLPAASAARPSPTSPPVPVEPSAPHRPPGVGEQGTRQPSQSFDDSSEPTPPSGDEPEPGVGPCKNFWRAHHPSDIPLSTCTLPPSTSRAIVPVFPTPWRQAYSPCHPCVPSECDHLPYGPLQGWTRHWPTAMRGSVFPLNAIDRPPSYFEIDPSRLSYRESRIPQTAFRPKANRRRSLEQGRFVKQLEQPVGYNSPGLGGGAVASLVETPSARHKTEPEFRHCLDQCDPGRVAEDLFNFEELLYLQSYIMRKFHWAYVALRQFPDAATMVRKSLCECQLIEQRSLQIILRFETTSSSVLQILPDACLGVREQEPRLASDLFNDICQWIDDIRRLIDAHQTRIVDFCVEVVDLVTFIQGVKLAADREFVTTATALSHAAKWESLKQGDLTGSGTGEQNSRGSLSDDEDSLRLRGEPATRGWRLSKKGAGQQRPNNAWKVKQEFYNHALRMSELLIRSLDELRQIEQILRQTATFWVSLGSVIDKLLQMKVHSERLLNYSVGSPKLAQRFFDRMEAYYQFWTALREQVGRYMTAVEAKTREMQDFGLALENAADRVDTASAARLGRPPAMLTANAGNQQNTPATDPFAR